MRLKDLDGDVYVSESLMQEFERSDSQESKETHIYVETKSIGSLKGFTLSSKTLEVNLQSKIGTLEIFDLPIGGLVSIEGIEMSKEFFLDKISYDTESLLCTLTAILKDNRGKQ